jgi:LCP family protein required for cell wall assembly
MAKQKRIEDIQTGRNLPKRYSSYSPTHPVDVNRPAVDPQLEVPKKKHWFRRIFFGLFLIIFVTLLIIGVWDARNISSAETKMFGSGNLLEFTNMVSLKGNENGRVNVLLIGYSVDDPGHPAATLTDSIILLSMSTTSHTGYMLSIPRDLYVKIPGFGYGKINEAYQDGGPDLLEQIVTSNFNLPVDYYALINYAAVRDSVNALNGISVNIQSSDPRGLYDPNISPHDGGPLKLSNGSQQLDGQTALNLSRARGDAYGAYGFPQSDFDRTQHQRQILTAIKAKLSWKLVLDPRKNSQILNAAANNIKTDVQADEARPLFGLFNNIPSANLQSISLRQLDGKNYLSSYTTSSGQSALIPSAGINDYSDIDAALNSLNQ